MRSSVILENSARSICRVVLIRDPPYFVNNAAHSADRGVGAHLPQKSIILTSISAKSEHIRHVIA